MWTLMFTWLVLGQVVVGGAPVNASTGSSLSATFASHAACVTAAKKHESNLAGQTVHKTVSISITWDCTPTGPGVVIHKNVAPTKHKSVIRVLPKSKPTVIVVPPGAKVIQAP